jgi:hypothetical protein
MSRTRAMTAVAALLLGPGLVLGGCRGGDGPSRQTASVPPVREPARPPAGTSVGATPAGQASG